MQYIVRRVVRTPDGSDYGPMNVMIYADNEAEAAAAGADLLEVDETQVVAEAFEGYPA